MPTHDTPATYTREEAELIRSLVLAGSRPVCPRCAEQLLQTTPVTLADVIVQEITCPVCHRCVIIREEPTGSSH